MKKQNKQGFTLVELMVVVIIVGILAAVAVPLMSANKSKAITSELIAGLGSIETAARMYSVENGQPADCAALIAAGFLAAADLGGPYFTSAQMQATADSLGFTATGLLADGAATAVKGVTVTKAAGKYTSSGTYTP